LIEHYVQTPFLQFERGDFAADLIQVRGGTCLKNVDVSVHSSLKSAHFLLAQTFKLGSTF